MRVNAYESIEEISNTVSWIGKKFGLRSFVLYHKPRKKTRREVLSIWI